MVVAKYKKMIMALVPDNLKEQLAKEKGTVMDGVVYLALACVILVIMMIISVVLSTSFSMLGSKSAGAMALVGGGMIVEIVLIVVLLPLIVIVGSLIGHGIMYLIAKALGGTGTYAQQFYHMAVFGGGIIILNAVFSIIPCLGSVAQIVLGLYSLYLAYLVYQSVHKLSSGKAMVLALVPLIVGVVIAVIAAIMFAAMFAALAAGMAGGAYGGY